MAFNGSGVFVRLYNWVNDLANGININATRMDAETDGIATGLSNCITRDGQGVPSAAINWNGQNLTNVGAFACTTFTGKPGADIDFNAKNLTNAALVQGVNVTATGILTGNTANVSVLTAGTLTLSGLGAVTSGTYTPTGAGVANVAILTPAKSQWMRVGSVVSVTGTVAAACNPSVLTQFSLTLPVASNMTAQTDLAGTGVIFSTGTTVQLGSNIAIVADTTNDKAFLQFTTGSSATTSTPVTYTFSFQYEVK